MAITSPAGISGNYAVGTASFGPALIPGGLTGTVVAAADPSDSTGASTTDACSALTNASEVAGKIAPEFEGILLVPRQVLSITMLEIRFQFRRQVSLGRIGTARNGEHQQK